MRLPRATLAFLLATLVQAQTPTYQDPAKPSDVRIEAYITVLGAQSLAQADQIDQSANWKGSQPSPRDASHAQRQYRH